MFPSTVILDSAKTQQQKIILIRNPTSQDMIVKFYPSDSVFLEKDRLAVEANKMVCIKGTFVLPQKPVKSEILVYVRPVTDATLPEMRDWLTVYSADSEKRSHRAFKVTARLSASVFSAPAVILDLPGNAVFHAEKVDLEDVATAQNGLPKRAVGKKLPSHENSRNNGEKACTFFRRFLDVVYPPATKTA